MNFNLSPVMKQERCAIDSQASSVVKKELSNYQRGRVGLTATHKASVGKVQVHVGIFSAQHNSNQVTQWQRH